MIAAQRKVVDENEIEILRKITIYHSWILNELYFHWHWFINSNCLFSERRFVYLFAGFLVEQINEIGFNSDLNARFKWEE